MKKNLLLLTLFTFGIAAIANAQDQEGPMEKGLLLMNLARPAIQGYETVGTILDISSPNDINLWETENFTLSETGDELVTTGNYTNMTSYSLESPPIQLPVLGKKRDRLNLYLEEKFSLESYHDEALIQISMDNGQTWTTLSARSGKSALRTSVINLTAYSGQEVRLAFRLDTDDSYVYEGWTIKSIQIRQDILRHSQVKATGKKVTGQNYKLLSTDSLNGNLSSLDAQEFPRFIFANVSVSEGDTPISSLDESNFSIVETIKDSIDDVRTVVKDNTFKVYAPDSTEISRPVDIVFLMDNSGSMGNEQDSVSDNVESFVYKLDSLGFDYRLGLCRFGQGTNSGKPIFYNNAGWFTDGSTFVDVWDSVNTTDGSREPAWDALYYSSQEYDFASAAQRIFIIITDEAITGYPGNNLPYSEITDKQLVIDQLQAVGIKTYALTLTGSPFDSDFGAIADSTGGKSYDILSPFNDILDNISTQISNTYTIRYTPTKPMFDGLTREVDVTIDYNGKSLSLFGEYTPGAAPVVLRTDSTLALHKEAQQFQTEIKIKVKVLDEIAPFPANVFLYYRVIDTESPNAYIQAPMVKSGSGPFWSTIIPRADVLDPGIEYYIRASDGESTTTAPEFINREGYPWSFAVLPNLPPTVTNKTVAKTLKAGDTIRFEAEAIDNTDYIKNVWVYVYKPGGIDYQPYKMASIGSDKYEFRGLTVQPGLTRYFIVAEGNQGVSTFDGSEKNPYIIATDIPWTVNNSASERHQVYLADFDFSTFTPWSVEAKLGGENLAVGDYIGVFFTDTTCAGDDCEVVEKCGGFYAWNGQPRGFSKFPIYGDDTTTPEKDGFIEGDSLIFKVYRKKDQKVYDAYHSFRTPSDFVFTDGGLTRVDSILAYYEQQTLVKKNLNLWSTYLEPKDKSFDAMFADYVQEIRKVLDIEGNVWQPGGTSNTLTTYEPGYGYEVYMVGTGTTITVKGNKLDIDQINLIGNQQSTLVGCPYMQAENVEAAFSNHASNVYAVDRYINDGTGFITIETYSPMFGINNWTDKNMRPGEAYFVFALNPDPSFTFPQPSGPYAPSSARMAVSTSEENEFSQHVRSTERYMNVIFPTSAWSNHPSGDNEIRAYHSEEGLIGKVPFNATGNSLILDGLELKEEDTVEFRLWSSATEEEYPIAVNSWFTGNGLYANHTVSVAESLEILDSPVEDDGTTVFPNPAQGYLKVRFVTEKSAEVRITLTDLQGEVAKSIQYTSNAGSNLKLLDTSGIESGMYLLKITQGDTVKVESVLID